ncbi:MAG: histidine--tRNA ligase [Candidatus Nanoarchaeia archaeon]|jgi:histidyl-tRNA synthetase|nr:histidine--tRNA ligase [Candidatus Nanoarchaeia archaeon]|tara:strand:- start:5278 stop:6489 length:1212 start_codon:yes stop_codon:yes gene_type:complete
MEFLNAKGTKDITPEDKIVMDSILNNIKEVFESYGYNPLDTPLLERFEVLSSKYAGGVEILKEIFKLKDQGDRDLGLRYDLTVPLARFIAMNSNIKLPFKRYQIGKVFRDGPVSSNRIREFTQCDVDVIGSKSLAYDAEMLAIVNEVFKKLNFKFKIKINNRKIIDSLLDEYELKNKDKIILILDKLEKIGEKEVINELTRLSNKKIASEIIKRLKSKNLKLKDTKGLDELDEVLKYAKMFNVKNIEIDYSLARGLSYYTGTIFEVFSDVKEALVAGGRYDDMISNFSNRNMPAVGISFGLDRIFNSYKKESKTITQVYVIPINTLKESLKIVNELRKNNIKVDVDLGDRSISKNLDYANKLNIPYVIFLGKQELKSKKLKLRDMKTGKEKLLSLDKVIKVLK